MSKKQRQNFLMGAAIISAGGFVSKLLGALYRIPLVSIIGGEGMGIYQMVYPLYCILLTVSASGIPTGVARLISSGEGYGAEKTAFRLYGFLGVVGAIAMFALSAPLAAAQGEAGVSPCCRLLSPSVFFVAIISVVRGYFQGKGDMAPTALSEVCEQIIKVAAGIFLSTLYKGDTVKATAAAVLAVTVSEVLTCVLVIIMYLSSNKKVKPLYSVRRASPRAVLSYTVPLTFTAIALPVSQLAESIAVVNILRSATQSATALYGVFSGCAVTIINLPVSITYGLAAASVPSVSPLAAKGDIQGAKRQIEKALLYTALVGAPCALALYIFAPLAANLIFSSLTQSEKELLITLVRVMSVNALTSSLVQTSGACITSLGYPLHGTVVQWLTSLLRVALSSALVAFTPLSVVGAAISANCSYFVAVVLNFWYIIKVKKKGDSTNEHNADRIGYKRGRYIAGG